MSAEVLDVLPHPGGRLLSTTMSEVLPYFARCPDCRYAATASAVVRHYETGVYEITLYASCAMPCGWGEVTRTTDRPARAHRKGEGTR